MSISPLSDIVASIKCALETSKLSPIIRCDISGENDSCGAKLDAIIVSAKFEGMPLLQRQKAVHEAVSIIIKPAYLLNSFDSFAAQIRNAACSCFFNENVDRRRGRSKTRQKRRSQQQLTCFYFATAYFRMFCMRRSTVFTIALPFPSPCP